MQNFQVNTKALKYVADTCEPSQLEWQLVECIFLPRELQTLDNSHKRTTFFCLHRKCNWFPSTTVWLILVMSTSTHGQIYNLLEDVITRLRKLLLKWYLKDLYAFWVYALHVCNCLTYPSDVHKYTQTDIYNLLEDVITRLRKLLLKCYLRLKCILSVCMSAGSVKK